MASLSDLLPESLQLSSTILSAGSQVAKANAMRSIAARRKTALEFEAAQQEISAQESSGVAMRAAQDEILRARTVNSTALAKAAASGAGASDPTVMAVLSRTAGEGAYRSAVAMYAGESQARLDRMRAAALRYQGDVGVADAEVAADFQLQTGLPATLLSGGTKLLSMFDKYWSGPKAIASATDAVMPLARVPSASGAWLDAGTDIEASIYEGMA